MSARSGRYRPFPANGLPGVKGNVKAQLHLAFELRMPEVGGGISQTIALFVLHHHPRRKFTAIR